MGKKKNKKKKFEVYDENLDDTLNEQAQTKIGKATLESIRPKLVPDELKGNEDWLGWDGSNFFVL